MKTLNLRSYLAPKKSPEEIRILTKTFNKLSTEELEFLHDVANFYDQRDAFYNHKAETEKRMDGLFERSCMILKNHDIMNSLYQDFENRKKIAQKTLNIPIFDAEATEIDINFQNTENGCLKRKYQQINADILNQVKINKSIQYHTKKTQDDNENRQNEFNERMNKLQKEEEHICSEIQKLSRIIDQEDSNEKRSIDNHNGLKKKVQVAIDTNNLVKKRNSIKNQLNEIEKKFNQFLNQKNQNQKIIQAIDDENEALKQKILRINSLNSLIKNLEQKNKTLKNQFSLLCDEFANLKRRNERQLSEKKHFDDIESNIFQRTNENQSNERTLQKTELLLKSRKDMIENNIKKNDELHFELEMIKKEANKKEEEIQKIAVKVKNTLQQSRELAIKIHERAHHNQENFNSFEEIEAFLRDQGVM